MTSDTIATALREGLADPYFDSVRNVAAVALAPVVERLLAEQRQWQPIDTAPKDRGIILGWPKMVTSGHWTMRHGGEWTTPYGIYQGSASPTRWMELPKA